MAHTYNSVHPSIPRVLCPRCGTPLRLASVEPEARDDRRSQMSFECECGFTYRMHEGDKDGGRPAST